VAIFNALKWSGAKLSWKKNKEILIRDCECINTGVSGIELSFALKKWEKKYGTLRSSYSNCYPTLQKIDKHLGDGGIILLVSNVKAHIFPHAYLIIEKTKHRNYG